MLSLRERREIFYIRFVNRLQEHIRDNRCDYENLGRNKFIELEVIKYCKNFKRDAEILGLNETLLMQRYLGESR